MSDRPQIQKQQSKYEIRQRLSSIDNELRISKVDLSHLNALANKDTESQWKERVTAIEKSTKHQNKLERKRHGRYSTGNITSSLPSSNNLSPSSTGGSGGGEIGTSLKDRLATFQKATKETINYYSDDESTVGPKGKNKKTAAQLLKEQYARKQRLAGKRRAVEKRMAAAPQSNTMGNSGGVSSGLNALSSLSSMGITADGCKPNTSYLRSNSADSIFSNDQQDDNRQPLVLPPQPTKEDSKGSKGGSSSKGGFDMGVGKPTSTKRVSMTSKVSSSTTNNNKNHQEEDDQSVLSSNYNLSIKQRSSKFGLSTSHLKTQSQRLDKLKSSNRKSGINNTQVIEKRMSAKEKMLHAKQLAEEKRLAGIKEKDKRGEKLNAKEKMLLAKSIKDDKRKAKEEGDGNRQAKVEGESKKDIDEKREEKSKKKEEEAQQLIDEMMLDMDKEKSDSLVTPNPSDTEPGGTSDEQKGTTTTPSASDTSPEKKKLTAKEKMMQAKALRDSKRMSKQQQVDTTSPTEVTATEVDQVTTLKKDERSSDITSTTPFIPTLTNDNHTNEKKAVTDFYRPTSRRGRADKEEVTSTTDEKKNDTSMATSEKEDTSKEKKLTAKEKMLQAKALAKSRRMSKKQEEDAAADENDTSPSAPMDNTFDSLNEQKMTPKKDNIATANNDTEKKMTAKEKMLQAMTLRDSKRLTKDTGMSAADHQVTISSGSAASATPVTSANQQKSASNSIHDKRNMSMVKDTTSNDTMDQVTSATAASPSSDTKPVVYNPYDMSTWHLKKKRSSTNEKTVSKVTSVAAVHEEVITAASTDKQEGTSTINNVQKQDQVVVPSTNKSKSSSDKIVEPTTDTSPVENPAVYNPYDKSTWHLKKERKSIDTYKKSKPDVSGKAIESPATVVSDDKVSTKLLGSSVDKVSSDIAPPKADTVDKVTSSSLVSDNGTPQSSLPKPMVYNPYDMSTWHLKKSKSNNNDKIDEYPATVVPKKESSVKDKEKSMVVDKDTATSVVQVTSAATDNSTVNEKIVESPVLEKTPSPSQQKRMTAKEKMLQSKAIAHSKRLEKLAQEKKRQEAIDEAWLVDQSMSTSATNDEHANVTVNPVYTTQTVKVTAKSDTSKQSVDRITSSLSTKEQKTDVSSSNEKIVDSLGKMMSAKEMSMHAKSIAQSKRLAASSRQAAPTASKVDSPPRPVSEFKKLFGSGAVSQETVEHIKAEAIKVEKQRQLAQEKTLSSLEKNRHAHTIKKSNDTAEDTLVKNTPLVTSSTTKVESSSSTGNDKAEKRRLAKEKMLQAKALTQSKRLERQAALDARANRLADLEKKSTVNRTSTSNASSTNELYQTKKKTLVSGGQNVSMMKETPDASRTSVSTSVTKATCLERVKAEAIAAEKARQGALDAAWLADQSTTSREGSLANLDVSHRSTSSTDYNMIEESSFVSFTKKELLAREKMMQAKARASQSKRSSISKRLEKLTDGTNEGHTTSLNDDASREVLDEQTNKMGIVTTVTDEQKAVSSIRTAEEAIKSESNASSKKKLTAKEKMIQAKALTQSKRLKKVAEEKKRQEAIDEAWLAEQEGLPTKESENVEKSSNESKNVSEPKKTVEVTKKSTKDRSIKVQGQVAPIISITTSGVNDSAFTSKFKKEIVNEAAIEKPKMPKTFAQSQQSTKVVTKEKLVKLSPKAKSTTGTEQSPTPTSSSAEKKSTSDKKLTAKERMVAAKARAQQKRLAAQLERERLENVKEAEAKKKSQAKKLADDKIEAEKKRQAALDAAWLSEQLEEAEDEESEERLEIEQKSRAAAKAAYRRRSAHGSSNISDGEDNMIGNSCGSSLPSSGGLGSLGLLSALPSSKKKKVSKCLRSVTENEDDDASVFTTKTIQTLQSQHTNAAKSVSSRSYYSRVHDEASIADIIKDKTRAKLKKKQLPKNPQILKTYKQWEIYHLENGRLYSTVEGELWSQKCYKNNPNGIVSRPVLPPDDRIAAVKAFLIARGLGRDDIKY